MSKPKASGRSDEWPVSWEGNRQAQLRAMLKATPAQRLEWLEAAIQLASQTGALQRLRTQEMDDLRSLFPKAAG